MGKWNQISKNKWEKFVSYRGRPNKKRIIVSVTKYKASYELDGLGGKVYTNFREGTLRKSWEFHVEKEITFKNGYRGLSTVTYVVGLDYDEAYEKAMNYMRSN